MSAALAACITSETFECGAVTCPSGTTCDPVHTLCVTPAQTTACAALADGDVCAAGAAGICDRGYCIPGCGDGVQDTAVMTTNYSRPAEECDDGNFASHDGCSSSCAQEAPAWNEVESPWRPRVFHASAYWNDAVDPRLVVFGGSTPDGVSDEHWERDRERTWLDLSAKLATRPSRRQFPAMAFDPLRKVIVLFGGTDNGLLGDTWEYDGSTWIERPQPVAPSPRIGAALAFDGTLGKLVLFGGADANGNRDDTWQYDTATSTWTELLPATRPPARSWHAMVWDQQRIVLFGGTRAGALGDTWVWNGVTWAALVLTPSPPPRYGAAMAHLPSSSGPGRIVLFGGATNNLAVTYSDSWELTATGWAPFAGVPALPPGCYFATLAYDAAVDKLVLVGGAKTPNVSASPDVWEYTATPASWSDRSPDFPPPRETTLAYDDAHAEVVGFSGNFAAGIGAPLKDTWVFDGARWAIAKADAGVPGRRFHATAYDSKRDRVIVFGGSVTGTPTDETLEWNGSTRTWSSYVGATKPPTREMASMTFDAKRGVTILFGGDSAGTARGDTWEYDGSTWIEVAGVGPPAQRFPPLAYDPVHERTILVDANSTTWAYADRAWTRLDVPPFVPHEIPRLAYNPARRRVTLFASTLASVARSELWELGPAGWERADVVGTVPPPRIISGFAAHPKARVLVMFGGGAVTGVVGDTWLFQYRSSTPDEDCADSVDNDADRHVDAADPDCQ